MLCSVEHPCQFFAEAQRLREQKLLLDEEVTDEVLAAAKALGAPRVKIAAQLRPEGLGKVREDEKKLTQAEELRENLHSIERLYREGIGCDLELEAEGYRLQGEGL